MGARRGVASRCASTSRTRSGQSLGVRPRFPDRARGGRAWLLFRPPCAWSLRELRLLSSPVCSGEQEVTYAGKGADRQKEDDMQQSRSLATPKPRGACTEQHRTDHRAVKQHGQGALTASEDTK